MTDTHPAAPSGWSHVVLNVRDIEATHQFWTVAMGWQLVGELKPPAPLMRFYRAVDGHHHDLAVMQIVPEAEVPPIEEWRMTEPPTTPGINHIAICFEREAWLKQIAHLQASGVPFEIRAEHGMTHSAYVLDPDGNAFEILYDLPQEVWEDHVDAALNHFIPIATEGPEALLDNTEYTRFSAVKQ